MIFLVLAMGLSVGFSLYFWGVIRTMWWLLPTVFLPDLLVVTGVSWLCFWSLAFNLAPWSGGAFDFRDLPKERWTLLIALTGIIAGTLLYSNHWMIFVICSLLPIFWVRFFSLVRHPPQEVLFLPNSLKLTLPALLVLLFLTRILETWSGGL